MLGDYSYFQVGQSILTPAGRGLATLIFIFYPPLAVLTGACQTFSHVAFCGLLTGTSEAIIFLSAFMVWPNSGCPCLQSVNIASQPLGFLSVLPSHSQPKGMSLGEELNVYSSKAQERS